jgi:NAD(P)-dependent dehydrogenase (short-subunit alcohol dehydrogenase family)
MILNTKWGINNMTITIISGASRGIGAAIASDLINLDHTFLLLSGHTNIAGVEFNNVNVVKKQIDFEDPILVYDYIRGFLKDKGKLDQINIILCASQLGSHVSESLEFDLEEISNIFKSNLIANLAIIKAVSEFIDIKSRLRVIFFGGGGAAYAYPEFFGYSLSKVATVRAVENLAIMLKRVANDVSIIALAPGAVKTDMLKKVLEKGGFVKTETDISEPVAFVRSFIFDEIPSLELNGMFIHVRDELKDVTVKLKKDKEIFKLRRVQ